MDSTIDRLFDENIALKATLRSTLNALRLVKMLHDNPDSLSFLGHSVKLDPKAYEQIKHAIMNAEDALGVRPDYTFDLENDSNTIASTEES